MTRDEIEAALCLWEAMLEARPSDDDVDSGDDDSWRFKLQAKWDKGGTAAMRSLCIDEAPKLEAAWLALSKKEQAAYSSFDWEFVPEYLSKMFS